MANKKKAAKETAETPVAPQAEVQPVTVPIIENIDTVVEAHETSNPEEEIFPQIGIIGAPPVYVCIPFLQSAAQGSELLYALRSMERNLREDFKVVIIGDRPEWLSDEALHIAHSCISENPQIDVIDKIKSIVACEEIPAKFVWTNDDIYFASPVSLADIETLKIAGELKDMPRVSSQYDINRDKTIALLESAKLTTRNFATHLPVVFDKEKIVTLFEEFDEINDGGFLFSSVYFNRHFADFKPLVLDWVNDNWSLRLVSKNPDPDKFAKLVNQKKWVNNSESGYSDLLINYLDARFPEKSKFEI